MIGLLFRSKYVSCFEIDLPSGRKGPFMNQIYWVDHQ